MFNLIATFSRKHRKSRETVYIFSHLRYSREYGAIHGYRAFTNNQNSNISYLLKNTPNCFLYNKKKALYTDRYSTHRTGINFMCVLYIYTFCAEVIQGIFISHNIDTYIRVYMQIRAIRVLSARS